MADQPIIGTTIRGFEVLSLDPTGKRVCIGCRGGAVHVASTDALLSGEFICAAAPLTPEQVERQRTEAERQRRRRELRDWRPGA
jgi:hypothetical protein